MGAPIETTHGFEPGTPRPLFQPNTARFSSSFGNYAVSRDGQRFLVNSRREQSSPAPLTVVVNWLATVQK